MLIDRNPTKPESEWRELVSEMYASGLSQVGWCKDNGINAKTMGNWIRKFKKEQDTNPVRFIDAGTVRPDPLLLTKPVINIQTAGYCVTVTSDFDTGALREVLKVLASL